METYTVSYTAEQFDQTVDLEIDLTVPNIDFVLPEFRQQVRLFKKIESISIKPNVQFNTNSNE